MSRIYFLLFIFTSILLTTFSYFFVDPNLSYLNSIYTGFSFDQRLITSVIFVSLISFLFILYFFLMKSFIEKKIDWNRIKKVFFISCFILFFSYPAMVSYDIFNYTTTAKVTFGYFENPYIVMPIEFSNEDFLSYTHAANKTALYGPFWLILTAVPYLLTSWNFIIMIFSFKLLVVFFYFLVLFLIGKITKDNLAVLFFGLNPLVLFETVVSGHNDVVMMFFALLSIYLLSKRIALSAASFFLSVMVKFATLFLIPVYIYLFWFKFRQKIIIWGKVYFVSALLMFLIFLLSPLREEIYPWYFIWVLIFISLTKNIRYFILTGLFSFFLMLRYVPFMYLGTHFGISPYLKIGITFGPLLFLLGIFTYLSLNSKRSK